jgi:hypothetical protein
VKSYTGKLNSHSTTPKVLLKNKLNIIRFIIFYLLYLHIKLKQKMKLHKFVGRETIELNSDEIKLSNKKLQGTKLKFTNNSIYTGRIYGRKVDSISMNGKHNYWGTQYKTKTFKAVAKKLTCYILKRKGLIQTDEIFKYIEGSEGTICYSVSLKLYGDFRYKYQRGWCVDTEIYSYYDYDDNLTDLLDRLNNYFNELKKDLFGL